MSTQVRDGTGTLVTKRDIGDLIEVIDGPVLTSRIVLVSAAGDALLSADADRSLVMVCSAVDNDLVVISPTGDEVALDEGIPLEGGTVFRITGPAAQSAMNQIGETAGQKLTVYTG